MLISGKLIGRSHMGNIWVVEMEIGKRYDATGNLLSRYGIIFFFKY